MITLDAKVLKDALQVVKESVGSEDDETRYILMEVSERKSVTIYSTNLLTFSRIVLESDNTGRHSFLLGFNDLYQYVGLWNGSLNLTPNKSHVIIKSGEDKVKLPTAQEAGFKKNFPKMSPAGQSLTVANLPYMISTAHRVVDPKASIDALKGIHIVNSPKKNILIVEAADGLQYISMNEKPPEKSIPIDIILNSDSARLISYLSSPGKMWVANGLLFYRCSQGVFAARLLAASNYPNLSSVSNARVKKSKVTLDKKELDVVIKKVGFAKTDRMEWCVQNRKSQISVQAKSKGVEDTIELESVLGAKVMGTFPEGIILDATHIGFLSSLLTGKVDLYFGSADDAVWYRDNNKDYLTLPFSRSREEDEI